MKSIYQILNQKNKIENVFGISKTIGMIFSIYVPLLDKIFQSNIVNDYKCIHYTSIQNVNNVINLQHSKKYISATDTISRPLFTNGITGGGSAIILSGTKILTSFKDLRSMIDQNGKRWARLSALCYDDIQLKQRYIKSFKLYFLPKVIQITSRLDPDAYLQNNTTGTTVNMSQKQRIFEFYNKSISSNGLSIEFVTKSIQLKNQIIKLFFSVIKFIMTDDLISKIINNRIEKQYYNQVVLTNFKILNIFINQIYDDNKQINNIKNKYQLCNYQTFATKAKVILK